MTGYPKRSSRGRKSVDWTLLVGAICALVLMLGVPALAGSEGEDGGGGQPHNGTPPPDTSGLGSSIELAPITGPNFKSRSVYGNHFYIWEQLLTWYLRPFWLKL